MAKINVSKALRTRQGTIPLTQMLKGRPGFLERVGERLAYPAIPPKGVELMPEHIGMPGMEEVGMAPTPTLETYTKLLQLAFSLKLPVETVAFILAGEAARPTIERALPKKFKMPATPSGMEAIPGFPGETTISPQERALFGIEAGGAMGASLARTAVQSAAKNALVRWQLGRMSEGELQAIGLGAARPTIRPKEAPPAGRREIPPEPSPFREPTFAAEGGESALLGRGAEPGTMVDITTEVPRGGRYPLVREDLLLRDISPEHMEAITDIPRRFGVKGPLAAGESPFPGRLPLLQILRGRKTIRGPEPLKAEKILVERVSKERMETLRRLRERGPKVTQEFELPEIPLEMPSVPRVESDPTLGNVQNKARTIGIRAWRGKVEGRRPMDPGDFGTGPYYTTVRSRAKVYGPISQHELKFENPLVLSMDDAYKLADETYNTIHAPGGFPGRVIASKRMADDLWNQGYDGLIAVRKTRGMPSRQAELEMVDYRLGRVGRPGIADPIKEHIQRVQGSPDPANVRLKGADPPTVMGEYIRGGGPNLDPEFHQKPWGLLPLQVTRKDPAAHSIITRFLALDDLTDRVALRYHDKAFDILKRGGITRKSPIETHDELIFALESPRLKRTMPAAEYQVLASNVRQEIWDVARLLRNEIEDPLYLMAVKDSMTQLPDDVAARFRERIRTAVGSQDVAAVNAAVEEARAVGAKGMPFYLEGHFTHFPVEREFHDLFNELIYLSEQLEMRGKTTLKSFLDKHRVRPEQIDPTVLRAIAADDVEAQAFVQRITSLKLRMGELERQRFHITPERAWFGPLSASRAKGDAAFLKNVYEVYDQYIPGATRKMMLDQFLPYAKNTFKANEGRWPASMRDYIYEFTSSARGTIGARHKEWIRNFIRGTTGKEIGHRDIDRWINFMNGWQVAFKLGIPRLRALALQTTQPLMTLWPELHAQARLLGIKNPAAAELAFIRGFRKAFFGKEGQRLSRAVRAARSMQSRAELTGDVNRVQTAMLYLFDHLETWNRSWAVAGGDELARMAGMRGIRAARVGRTISDNANYIYTIGNRPLLLRGPFGRTFGIFKTFSINYGSQAARLFRTDKVAFAKMMTGLVGVGGTAAVPLYEVMRRVLLSNVGTALPEFRGLADSLPELAGLGEGFDLGQSLDPFGLPESQNQILRFLAGPNVTPFVDAIYGGPPEALGRLTSSIYPSFRGFGRAAEELSTGRRLHVRTGRPLATGRAPIDIILGATGLQKTPEQLRWETLQDLRAAFKGGNTDEVSRVLAEARERNIVISEAHLRGIIGDIMRERQGTMILPSASRFLRAVGGR